MPNQTNIKNALQRPYDLQLFATEVLNPVFAGNFQMQQLTPATIEPTQTESKSIAKVYTYGKINLDDDTEIICYEINLKPKVKIEQNSHTTLCKTITKFRTSCINKFCKS